MSEIGISSKYNLTVNAALENCASKTEVQDGGAVVYWKPEDEIKVFWGDASGRLISTNKESSVKATFTGTLSGIQGASSTLYGLYPYCEDASCSDGVIMTTLPGLQYAAEGTFDPNANIAMAVSDSHELNFKNVCGGLRFTLTKPDIRRIVFESNGGEHISGEFSAQFEDGVPVVKEVTEGSCKVTLLKEDRSAFEVGVWYYITLLPCTLSEGYTVTFSTESKSAVLAVGKEQVIKRGTYGTITEIDKSLTWVKSNVYEPISWGTDSASIDSVSEDGTYVISYTGTAPVLSSGTLFNADTEHKCELRIVSSVNQDGNRLIVHTQKGMLSDLFENTTLLFTTEQETKASLLQTGNVMVCHPVSIVEHLSDGTTRVVPYAKTKSPVYGSPDLFKWTADYSGETLWESGSASLSMETSKFDLGFDFNLALSLGDKDQSRAIAEGFVQWFSKTLAVKSWLSGTYKTEQVYKLDVNGEHNYSTDVNDRLIKADVIRKDMIFMAGEVPVYIGLGVDLNWEASIDASGELSILTGFTQDINCSAGVDWTQEKGLTPIREFSETHGVVLPIVEGRASVDVKASVYPHIRAMIYSMVGPSFDIKPYLSGSLTGGFSLMSGDSSSEYFAYSIKCNAGIDANFGLSIGFLNQETANLSTKDFNVADKLLFRSPEDIRLESQGAAKRSESSFPVGKQSTATFTVYDYNGVMDGAIVSSLPHVVKFEGDGTISKNFTVATKGKASVDWTPENGGDLLNAVLYDINGCPLAKAEAKAKAEADPCPEAIDLGLSVKWATCNVGASKPEDYGGYYQWAGTKDESTSILDWDNCPYHTGSEPVPGWTKYIPSNMSPYWSSSGNPDNKTVLDPEDDIAHVTFGGKWRMPTNEDFAELINNCDVVWTTLNGVNGRKFTSRKNGNSIFLPAAGCRSGRFYDVGSRGYYWSSSLSTDDPTKAIYLYSYIGSARRSAQNRLMGQSVRPVLE